MLFSEPKIPQTADDQKAGSTPFVSVLFSEPKIPQTQPNLRRQRCDGMFQCSSASRKFLKPSCIFRCWNEALSFSALQRAENSSNRVRRRSGGLSQHVSVLFSEPKIPQTRILTSNPLRTRVSVLFSEPKIPQQLSEYRCDPVCEVSVLFSEPKIPQTEVSPFVSSKQRRFQCSSASRKFLKLGALEQIAVGALVSVLFSEPKIPQTTLLPTLIELATVVSVLFSEPKIPQTPTARMSGIARRAVSVLFSEPKIPQT